MNKYEVAPGLFIGSEIGDINRKIKVLTKNMLDGDDTKDQIVALLREREKLLMRKT